MNILVHLLVAFIVMAIIFWLLQRYVTPLFPPPWGNAILAIAAIIAILYLLVLLGVIPAFAATTGVHYTVTTYA